MSRTTFSLHLEPAIADAVVFLSFPTAKNSISLGPFVTNESSELSIDFQTLDAMAKAERSTALMDYGPELPSGARLVTVEVESRHSLERRIKGIQSFYPEDARRLAAYMTCRGFLKANFEATIPINHTGQLRITLPTIAAAD